MRHGLLGIALLTLVSGPGSEEIRSDLPPARARVGPARLSIGVGEAYDFELTPESPGEIQLLARTGEAGPVSRVLFT